MEYWTQQTLNGLTLAAVLFLLASGLTLIYGLMGVLNLAHGSFYLVGAFTGLAIMNRSGNFLIGAVLAVVAVAAMGAVVQLVLISRVQDNPSAQVLLTFGLVLIAADIALWIGRGRIRVLPKPALFDGAVDLGVASYPKYRLLVIGVGVVIAFGSWLLQDHTKLGAILRAAVDDQEMASGIGTNVPRLFTMVFALGAGLGALAGVMAGPFFGVFQGVDLEVLILAFVVVIVGGTGSLTGAIVGSLAIGMADTFGKVWFPRARQRDGVPPDGRDPRVAAGRSVRASMRRLPSPPGARALWALAILAVLTPLGLDSFYTSVATQVLIFALAAMSLDILMGYTGFPSLGHAGFFGVGAYTVGLVTVRYFSNLWIVLLLGVLAGCVVSALVGVLALRTRGVPSS